MQSSVFQTLHPSLRVGVLNRPGLVLTRQALSVCVFKGVCVGGGVLGGGKGVCVGGVGGREGCVCGGVLGGGKGVCVVGEG